MRLSNTLVSALRALSSVPDLESRDLREFSQSVDDTCPAPDGSFGAHPIWRIPKGAPPPPYFDRIITHLRDATGLVTLDQFFAFDVAQVELIFAEPCLIDIMNDTSGDTLTGAETRLAIQMLLGVDLRTAAQQDDISYETKRSQFRTLSSKLGVRGQTEVVRLLTTQVIQKMAHLAQPQCQSDLETYAAQYLPPQVRRLSLTAATGDPVPVLDYGPVTGTPMIVLHPMIFPPIGEAEIEQANLLGLRLIWPLRRGLLDRSAPLLPSKTHLDASITGVITVLEQLIGRPTPLLALVSSGAVACGAATRRPDLITSITFGATCYSAGRNGSNFAYFGADLAELALRSEAIMTRTVAALRKYASNDDRFRSMINTVFQGSTLDLAHVMSEYDGPDQGARLRDAVLQSSESIKQDYFNQTHFRWTDLQNLPMPKHFIQGADDAIHPPAKLAHILQNLGEADLEIADNMGHLPHRHDLRRIISFTFENNHSAQATPSKSTPFPSPESCL